MSCIDVPEMAYGEFGERLVDALDGKRAPLKAMLELTDRCNLHCAHCYISQPAGHEGSRKKELSTEQWCAVLDQLAEEGCLWLLITGGEPLLRPDFQDIYAYAKTKGFVITLFTNATLFTPALADFLEIWYPERVSVTMYGLTAETYERVTGIPGSHKRFVRGLGLLQERNIPYDLKSVIMTLNVHEYSAMREYVEGLGLDFKFDPIIRPRIADDDGRNPTALRISPEQVIELEKAVSLAGEEWNRLADQYGRPPQTDMLYQCGAGLRSLVIDAYGQMGLCSMSREPSYDVLTGSVKEGFHDFLYRLRFQSFTRDYACRHCDMGALCARCPAFAALENGDPETVVEYTCCIAHLRAKTFVPGKLKGRTR